jgi:hypothetical protein
LKKAKKQTTFKEDAGKLLLDLGKLVFGGIFLGSICEVKYHIPYCLLADLLQLQYYL